MLDPYIPGTTVKFTDNDDSFALFKNMINVTNGLHLNQICQITDLQTSTIQNWVKRGYVPHPVNKKYYDRHLARILLISSLRECMKIEDIGELMFLINGDADDISDDIVSEEALFNYFALAIKRLDLNSITPEGIDSTLSNILAEANARHRRELLQAIKVMIYSFISLKCQNQVDACLEKLKKLKH
ncbi:MAG: DUF1836 domain-containing protein [Erysipelotrichaceae bacterium]|nr:DUF1836 domain-containing protein [Erysipelotrichaceae bacterium]